MTRFSALFLLVLLLDLNYLERSVNKTIIQGPHGTSDTVYAPPGSGVSTYRPPVADGRPQAGEWNIPSYRERREDRENCEEHE